MKRRKFLNLSALATSSVFVPKFLKAFENRKLFSESNNQKILVVVQLSGGNDGLNTVVPYNNDIYFRSRPKLGLQKNEILQLNGELGFNAAMTGLRSVFDDGNLCVINSVGYPNPDHSHFRSMDIWQTASGSDQLVSTGWIGRYLDANCVGTCKSHMAIEIDDALSFALKGEKINGFAMRKPARMDNVTRSDFVNNAVNSHTKSGNENVDYLYKITAETFSSAGYILEHLNAAKNSIEYPDNQFGNDLKNIAKLILSDIETKVYYVSHVGFDTHVNQLNAQSEHLKIISDGLKSFTDDLKNNNRLDDVMVMVFSEFGRRVTQNASGGTDHGTANNMFIINGALKKKGFYNEAPDLTDLYDGDLKFKLDFRNVYATALDKWLGTDSKQIIGKQFEDMNFI